MPRPSRVPRILLAVAAAVITVVALLLAGATTARGATGSGRDNQGSSVSEACHPGVGNARLLRETGAPENTSAQAERASCPVSIKGQRR